MLLLSQLPATELCSTARMAWTEAADWLTAPSELGTGGSDLLQALACGKPHPGGTIFTHLNLPSREALSSRLGH